MSLLSFTIFSISLQAITPLNSADKNPIAYGNDIKLAPATSSVENPSIIFSMSIPNIGTRTIRNENFVASCLLIFRNIAAEIVAPDLEIPGKIANACTIPITRASTNETLLPSSSLLKYVKNNRREVMSNIDPTRMMFPVKNDSTLFSNKMPIIPTGILDIIIFNTVSISFLLKLKTPFMILKMSALKTYIMLIAVAI